MIRAIRGLGRRGLILDQDPYDVPVDALSDGNNVAIVNGKLARMTGGQTHYPHAVEHVAPYFQPSAGYLIYIKENEWVRESAGGVYSTVTPTGTVNSGTWQSQSAGRFLIVNNDTQPPFILSPTDQRFRPLPNWPSDLQCQIVRPYAGFLVAIGLTEGGTDQPYVVRWSDTVEPGTLEPTWDYTQTTNLAGRNELAGGDGAILDMRQLGDQNILYLRDAVYSMQYVGGQFVFNFRKLFDDDGIIGTNAVAEFQGKHLVVGQDDIYVHDGSAKQSISDGRVSKFFQNTLRNRSSVRVERILERDEVWILYSDTDDIEANRALVYNYLYDAWTKVDLPERISQLAVAPKLEAQAATWGDETSWASLSALWSNINPPVGATSPYFVAADKVIKGNQGYTWNGTPILAFAEQSKLDLDEVFGETQSLKRIKRILPQMAGTGTVTLRVGVSNTPLSVTRWVREKDYSLETDHKADLRAQGRYLALRMDMPGEGNFELSGWDIDIDQGHGR